MSTASDANSGTSGGPRGKQQQSIAEMLGQLDLQEEDFNDVIVDEVEEEIKESVQWLALARVQTDRGFIQAAFFAEMRAAWNLAQGVRFRAIGENLFVVQVNCLGDCERHEYKDCGRGVHEEKDHKFADWLYANPPPRPAMRGGFGGGSGSRTSRGGGNGRGSGRDKHWRDGDEEDDPELRDTGTSPGKTRDMVIDGKGEKDQGARKRLNMGQMEIADETAAGNQLRITDGQTI
ncbi:hypothetical protein QYE76_055523 [Lolium multiflorum]|uniref:Uncharacterized protein n=1 Tax=Lolium multiflorum TaxID=4521 RepID=A0AAD8T0X6_LOLMU|nr:hypothetical protein QYE76_055523 [Lolium multiflorum]